MKIVFYGNGGSGNHGCEAIVRGTSEIFDDRLYVLSNAPQEDYEYQLNNIAEIYNAINIPDKNWAFLKAYLQLKLVKNYVPMDGLQYSKSIDKIIGKADVAFSVGGDNYCYGGADNYAYLNKMFHKNGMKTVLWGCSIEPEIIYENEVTKDLLFYDQIVARESITYEALKHINAKVVLAPDPAFYMDQKANAEIDELFHCKTIGLNISPVIISNEIDKGIIYKNVELLIKYVLEKTDYNIALIPHVVWERNNDITILNTIKEKYNNEDRIFILKDYSAPVLKYAISKCDMFIGARTHATIAAYSSAVPTLVIGYSVKARGIARDLFGQEEHYVLPVQSIRNENQLLDEFIWLMANKEDIHNHLVEILPEYKKQMEYAVMEVERVCG